MYAATYARKQRDVKRANRSSAAAQRGTGTSAGAADTNVLGLPADVVHAFTVQRRASNQVGSHRDDEAAPVATSEDRTQARFEMMQLCE